MTLGHEKPRRLPSLDRLRRKMELDRMAAMLSRPGGRGYQVGEDQAVYGDERHDFDSDFDSDLGEDARPDRSLQATLDCAPERRRWGAACTTCF